MLTANVRIELTEQEARSLWASVNAENPTPEPASDCPKGRELAEWVACHAITTVESNWQDEYGINADIGEGACGSDTLKNLQRLCALDDYIDAHSDADTPVIRTAKEEREEIKEELGVQDLPEEAERELAEIVADYKTAGMLEE